MLIPEASKPQEAKPRRKIEMRLPLTTFQRVEKLR